MRSPPSGRVPGEPATEDHATGRILREVEP